MRGESVVDSNGLMEWEMSNMRVLEKEEEETATKKTLVSMNHFFKVIFLLILNSVYVNRIKYIVKHSLDIYYICVSTSVFYYQAGNLNLDKFI